MIIAWYDVVGLMGVILVLSAYLLLQLQRINHQAPLYSALNTLGAGAILVSLFFDFNLSAVFIEAAWLLISLFGLAQAMRR